jgi:predicted Zn finger-like uncharacterized protein
MRILCPLCEAAYQVPDSRIAAASRMRCGQCDFVFTPAVVREVPPLTEAQPPEMPRVATDGAAPPPPVVTYMSGTTQARQFPAAEPQPVEQLPPLAAAPSADASPAVQPFQEPLGAPPPYRPVEAVQKPEPARVEMAPPAPKQEPAAGMDIRLAGELGPPPPYRPIVQAGAAFERGPAPDLEPWRVASLMRMRAQEPAARRPFSGANPDDDDAEPDWSIRHETMRFAIEPDRDPREDGPDTAAAVRPVIGKRRGLRSFRSRSAALPGGDFGRDVRPIVPNARMLAAAAAGMVILLGIAFYTQREDVMRNVPETVRVYSALGLAARPGHEARREPLLSKCAEAVASDSAKENEDLTTACPDTQPEAAPK